MDLENFKEALRILANVPIDSGCKADIAQNPEDDRCRIRQCCNQKGFDLCSECSDFPCGLLESNPGVIKFHCIENLKEIREKGIEYWIDSQLRAHVGRQ